MNLRAPCQAIMQAIIVIIVMGVSPALAAPTCPINYGAQAPPSSTNLSLLRQRQPTICRYSTIRLRFDALGCRCTNSIVQTPAYTQPNGHPDASRTVGPRDGSMMWSRTCLNSMYR